MTKFLIKNINLLKKKKVLLHLIVIW